MTKYDLFLEYTVSTASSVLQGPLTGTIFKELTKMVTKEDPELPSSHRHSKCPATYGTIHFERDLETR